MPNSSQSHQRDQQRHSYTPLLPSNNNTLTDCRRPALNPSPPENTPQHLDIPHTPLVFKQQHVNRSWRTHDRIHAQERTSTQPYPSLIYTISQQTVKDGVRLDAKKMQDAKARIQVLEAYLDEVRTIVRTHQPLPPGLFAVNGTTKQWRTPSARHIAF